MNTYLVNSIQSEEETALLLYYAEAVGYITHYKWIVCDKEYRGCAIIEADTELEALLSVPPFVRKNAKVLLLKSLSPGHA